MSGETKTFDELYADFNEQGESKYKLQKITVNDINLGILDSLLEIPRTLQFVDDNKSFSYKVQEHEDGSFTVYMKKDAFNFVESENAKNLPATTTFTIVDPAETVGGKKRRRKTAKNARKTNKRMKKRKSNRRR